MARPRRAPWPGSAGASVSPNGTAHPDDDAWVVKIHTSEDGSPLLGGGVVLDDHRVLTCAHVAGVWDEAGGAWAERETGVWVSFPNAEACDAERRFPVEWVALPSGDREGIRDVAVLHLAGPPPASVPAAPRQCVRPDELRRRRWRALGFVDAIGEMVEGVVGANLGHGWIRLDRDQQSQYPVTRGFSGSGLWSAEYQAVVAIVAHEHGQTGGGRAVTLHQAAQWLPDEGIKPPPQPQLSAGADEAAKAWNWSLSGDPEGARHWRTSGRGVTVASEYGFRFRGRTAALRAVRDWLDWKAPGQQVLVVTGAPGTGKSAVLGRIVTTANRAEAGQLPASDDGVRAKEGAVGCAVHAKGKIALEIAVEIARAARAEQPVQQIEDFEPALGRALSGHWGHRFNVIIDALDEAASPAQAHAAVEKVILPLARICADVGGSVVVGSRRFDADGEDLLGAFGTTARMVNLDDAEFFDEQDLAAYARVTLQLAGHLRPENPFLDEETGDRAVRRIVGLSGQNFLVAGLTARMLASPRGGAVDPASLLSSVTVDDAMREFLNRIPRVAAGTGATVPVLSAGTLLTPLAFAEAPGLSAGLWRTALRALGAGDVPEPVLTQFAKSSPAKFLIEPSGGDGQGAAFQLFHQALNDVLLNARAETASRAEDETALTRAFMQIGRETEWERVPKYLLCSLPAHAALAGLVDSLLGDDEYLLKADLHRVYQVAGNANTQAARDRTRLLELTLRAATAGPPERAAMFSVTEALADPDLGTAYRQTRRPLPYRARWAAADPSYRKLALQHSDGPARVWCAVTVKSKTLLAIASDETVGLLALDTGTLVRNLHGYTGRVRAMCAVEAGDRTLLATASGRTVRLWNPANGGQVKILMNHSSTSAVKTVFVVETENRALLAAGYDNGNMRVWDPIDWTPVRRIPQGNTSAVRVIDPNVRWPGLGSRRHSLP